MKLNVVAWVTRLFSKRKTALELDAIALEAQLLPGSELKDGIAEAIALARFHKDEVTFKCNNIELYLTPDSNLEDEYEKFQNKKRHLIK